MSFLIKINISGKMIKDTSSLVTSNDVNSVQSGVLNLQSDTKKPLNDAIGLHSDIHKTQSEIASIQGPSSHVMSPKKNITINPIAVVNLPGGACSPSNDSDLFEEYGPHKIEDVRDDITCFFKTDNTDGDDIQLLVKGGQLEHFDEDLELYEKCKKEQISSGINQHFEEFTCLAHSTTSILSDTLRVTCHNNELKCRARLCLFEDFELISKKMEDAKQVKILNLTNIIIDFFQVLLGPIVEIELMKPEDLVPEGVTIAIKHFLTMPSTKEFKEAVEKPGDCHNIMRVRKDKNSFVIDKIDSQSTVTSTYISSNNFQNHSMCHITTTCEGNDEPKCRHSSLKNIIVTKHKDMCPHKKSALALNCYCEASVNKFDEMISLRSHEKTEAIMEHNIEKSTNMDYTLEVSTKCHINPQQWNISHNKMCKYNGAIRFGLIRQEFDCSNQNTACNDFKTIYFKVTEHGSGDQLEDGAALKCNQLCLNNSKDNILETWKQLLTERNLISLFFCFPLYLFGVLKPLGSYDYESIKKFQRRLQRFFEK